MKKRRFPGRRGLASAQPGDSPVARATLMPKRFRCGAGRRPGGRVSVGRWGFLGGGQPDFSGGAWGKLHSYKEQHTFQALLVVESVVWAAAREAVWGKGADRRFPALRGLRGSLQANVGACLRWGRRGATAALIFSFDLSFRRLGGKPGAAGSPTKTSIINPRIGVGTRLAKRLPPCTPLTRSSRGSWSCICAP